MRLLRIHAPGTDSALAGRITHAIAEFNRLLDIRLRFLSIVIEDCVLDVSDATDATDIPAVVEQALDERSADVIVLLGGGAAAVSAATVVAARATLLVRVGAGDRTGGPAGDPDASRAVDRMAGALIHHGDDPCRVLDEEALKAVRVDVGDAQADDVGERIVRAIARVRRLAQGGS